MTGPARSDPGMSEKEDFEPILGQMRRDWNERATQDAQQYVYTRDVATDESDFEASPAGSTTINWCGRFFPFCSLGVPPKTAA